MGAGMTAGPIIQLPDTTQFRTKTEILVAGSKELSVIDADSYTKAGAFLIGVKSLMKEIVSTFKPIEEKWKESKRLAEEGRKLVAATQDRFTKPLDELSEKVERRMITWKQEQERKALAVAKEEEVRRKKALEDEQLAAAQRAQDAGAKEEAEIILNLPTIAPAVKPEPEVPKVAGLSFRKNWKYEVLDFAAIPVSHREQCPTCKGRAWIPNHDKITKEVKVEEAKTAIAGIRAFNDEGSQAR